MKEHREEQVRARWSIPAAVQPPTPSGLVASSQYQAVQDCEVASRYPIYQVGIGRTGLDDCLDPEPGIVPGTSKTAV